jgi:voltage-gated sodium channel type X alpha
MTQKVLKNIDLIFTCLFTIEAMIKILAKGFMFNELGPIEPYIRSYWNILDGFVVMSSLVDLAMGLAGVNMSSL